MKFGIFTRSCIHQDRSQEKSDTVAPLSYSSVNLREEYANAFRTESYNEFWARVMGLTSPHGSNLKPVSANARLPSYRLFTENLLDPDQPTVTRILTQSRILSTSGTYTLLTNFFTETANASLLCGLLLKNIDHIRTCYSPLKPAIRSNNLKSVAQILTGLNPFNSLTSAQLKLVQAGSAHLFKQLEQNRKKTRSKLRFITRAKQGLAVLFVVLVTSTSIMGAFFHGLAALVVIPGLVIGSGRLNRVLAQLDAATKGMYILNRDLDTISRLVERMHDEVEHIVGLVRFSMEKSAVVEDVVKEILRNDVGFDQKLDELEEHLFLCSMTINKARGIVMKEVDNKWKQST